MRQTVKEEDTQNQELLDLSNQILKLTKEVHAYTTRDRCEITSSPPSGEHPMHDGDPVASRADLQHERPVGSRYLPTRPRAAAVLDGCQRAQFIFDAHVVVERQLEPVVGREPLDSRFGPQALPALRLRSQILRRERA